MRPPQNVSRLTDAELLEIPAPLSMMPSAGPLGNTWENGILIMKRVRPRLI